MDGINQDIGPAEQKLNSLTGKVPAQLDDQAKLDAAKTEGQKPKAPTCGDPVRMATGDFVLNETDLLYKYINNFIEIKRSYQSNAESAHSLGKSWAFNYDERIIMGARYGIEAYTATLTALLSEINTFLNSIVLPMQTKMGHVTLYISSGKTLSGYSSAIEQRVSSLVTNTTALRDNVSALLTQATKELRLTVANKAKNVYTFNGTDPEYQLYTGNLTLNYIDENGAQHLYTIDEAPNYGLTVKYPDGNTNFFIGGSSTTPAAAGDDKIDLLADGSYILTKKNQAKYYFSYYGQLQKIADANGNEITFNYSANKLREIKDGFARSIIIDRDSNGRIIKTTDPKGRITLYTYNGEYLSGVTDPAGDAVGYVYSGNLLTEIKKPDNTSRKYSYIDISGKKVVSSTTDENNNTEYFTYDIAGKCTKYTNAAGVWENTYYNDKFLTEKTEYSDGSTVLMEYDDNDNLIKRTDQMGRIYQFKYDGNKNIIEATGPDNTTEKWTYNSFNKIASYQNKSNYVTNYYYDGNGNLISIQSPDTTSITYEYNNQGQITKYIDQNNNAQLITYDDYGYTKAVRYPEGNIETFENDIVGNVTKVTDPEGNATVLSYNADNKVIKAIDCLGLTEIFIYNNRKDLIEKTDKNGNKITIQYDKSHNPLKITNPKGETIKYIYRPDGKMTQKVLNDVNHTQYAYDGLGKVISITQKELNIITQFNYDAAGNVLSKTDGNGNQTIFHYDNQNRLAWIKNPDSTLKQFNYDINGNLITSVDEAGNATQYHYDLMDKVIGKTDPMNHVEQYFYDKKGAMTRMTDPNGNTIVLKYNKNGKLIEVDDPLNQTVTYEYNLRNLPVKMTDKKGNVRQNVYDNLGRLIKEIDSLNNYKEYGYDGNGNMLYVKDENSNVTRFEYDALNKVTAVYDAYNNKTAYSYNYLGLVVKESDALNNSVLRNYDEIGRLVKETNQLGAIKLFEYDHNNNLKKLTDELNRVKSYTYNNMDRMIEELNALGETIAYQYDAVGNLVLKTDSKNNPYICQYDKTGNLIKETNSAGKYQTYVYDSNGNMLSKIDFSGNETRYSYDKLNRLILTVFADNTKKEFDYDGNNNILRAENDLKCLTLEYDALNRLVKQIDDKVNQTQKMKYDKTGNRIEMSWLEDQRVVSYNYGKRDELLGVTDPEKGKTEFTYDVLGREIKKIMTNGVIVETVYDAAGRVTAIKNYNEKTRCYWKDSDNENQYRDISAEASLNPDTTPTVKTDTTRKGIVNNGVTETGFNNTETIKVKLGFQNEEHGHNMLGKSYAYVYNAAGERTYQVDDEGNVSAYQYDEAARIKTAMYPFRSDKKVEDLRERLYLGLFPDCDIKNGDKDDFVFDLPLINIPFHDHEKFENSLRDVFKDNDDLFKAHRKLDSRHFPRWYVKKGLDGTDFIKKLDLDSETVNSIKSAYANIGNSKAFNTEQWMWLETFAYDPNSNITNKANGWGKINYAFDNTNALTKAGNRNYSYDFNGNLMKETLGQIEANYEYSPENRVTDIYTEIQGFLCHKNWVLKGGVGYDYDAFGRRSASADYNYSGFKNKFWNTQTNENYLYDGLSFNVLADFWQEDFDTGHGHHHGWGWWGNHHGRHNPVTEYIYGNGKIITKTEFQKSANWFGENRNPKWNDKTYYSHDILGSVMLLTKHKGQAVDTYNYDVFGNNYDGTFLSRNEFGFNGKRFDPAVKLYDYGFRDYNPVMMRFTTIDPICAGLNWYAYCNNDPVNFVDPFGLSPSDKKYLQIPTIPKFEYSGFLLNVPAVVDNCVINVGNGFIDLGNSLLYTAQYTWNNGLKETGKEIVREFQALGNNIVETGKVIGQGYLNSFNNYLKDPKAQFNSEIAYLKKTVTSPQTYETVGTIVAGIYTGKALSGIKIPTVNFVSTETKVTEVLESTIRNPYGKAGGPLHQGEIQKIIQDIKTRDLIPVTEYKFPVVGGLKSVRYADVVATDPLVGKVVEIYQVGKVNSFGFPVTREYNAIKDIFKSTSYNGAPLEFVPYNLKK